MQLRHLNLIVVFILISFAVNAQSSLLDRKLQLKEEQYTAKQLVDAIRQAGITLNFSGSLPVDTTYQGKTELRVKEILGLIFDQKRYTFIQRNDKILVIPTVRKKGYTFSGYVEEEGSQERLIGVNIYLPTYNLGTTSNEFGFFSLIVPDPVPVEAIVSFLGYQKKKAGSEAGGYPFYITHPSET